MGQVRAQPPRSHIQATRRWASSGLRWLGSVMVVALEVTPGPALPPADIFGFAFNIVAPASVPEAADILGLALRTDGPSASGDCGGVEAKGDCGNPPFGFALRKEDS